MLPQMTISKYVVKHYFIYGTNTIDNVSAAN